MLKERQKSILNAIIQEYIRTARPVASRDLTPKYKLGVGPATVRNEMLELDGLGYLEQPHTSAGRVPTDSGYRFFVDNLIADSRLTEKEKSLVAELFEIMDEGEFVREASRTMARVSNAFTALGLLEENVFYDAGFSEVTAQPEFKETESIKMFSRLVDNLENEVRTFFENFDSEADDHIFIGGENPFENASSCAVFISRFEHPQGFDGFITMIGPKRTNYSHHRALLKEFSHSNRHGHG